MPISALDLEARTLAQVCAICGAVHQLLLADLTMGEPGAPWTIRLPTCDRCGAQEQLLRTTDACPADALGSNLDLGRRAVNTLCADLLDHGQGAKEHADAHKAMAPAVDLLPAGKVHAGLHRLPPAPVDPGEVGGLTPEFKALQEHEDAEAAAAGEARHAATVGTAQAAKAAVIRAIKERNATAGTAAAKAHAGAVQQALDGGNPLLAQAHAAAAEAAAALAGTDEAREAAAGAREKVGPAPAQPAPLVPEEGTP